MRLHVMGFRVTRFRAPSVTAPGNLEREAAAASDDTAPLAELVGYAREIGHPTAESQQAGLDHLRRVAVEQAAARLLGPVTDRHGADPAKGVRRTAPNAALPGDVAEPGDDRDGAPQAHRHS
jgi:hypothetical protein